MKNLRLARLLSLDWSQPQWRIVYYHDVPLAQRESFRAQLEWLGHLFHWVSIDEGLARLKAGDFQKPCATVTFDDADKTVFDVAMPVLNDLSIQGCVYVVPDYVDQQWTYRSPKPGPTMTWENLREWRSAGHQVGSHTMTHALMTDCIPERFRQEAEWSQRVLEEQMQEKIAHFAYPWGQFNADTHQHFADLGCYQTVATTYRGRMLAGHDPLSLRRDRVGLGQTPEELEFSMRLCDRFYRFRKLRAWGRRNNQLGNPEWRELLDDSGTAGGTQA